MTRYAVAGLCGATDVSEVLGHLWNPSSTISLYVVQASWSSSSSAGLTVHMTLNRSTTIGTTPGSTVTPDADNAFDRTAAPPSGAVLYLSNFATAPTIDTSHEIRHVVGTRQGNDTADVMFTGRGWRVPPGSGLAWFYGGVATNASLNSIGFTWDE